jgi:membrane associated rhomboid family serine protease
MVVRVHVEWLCVDSFHSRAAAEESALALSALDIGCRIEERAGGWELRVAAADAERAAATLAAYRAERLHTPVPVPAPAIAHPGGTTAGIGTAVLSLLFFAITNASQPARAWTARGSATAVRIFAGEWWRVVTSLTLHADLSHVVNNSVAIAVFATGVCRWFGPGVGLWLIVAAGAGGNALNAFARGTGHSAVGASTAVFGAVGILTTLQLSRRLGTPARGLMRMRVWAPVAAGLALLALLGSSQHSDVAAHLFGFTSGAVLGLAASRVQAERVGGWLQAALLAGLAAAVWGCWRLALHR